MKNKIAITLFSFALIIVPIQYASAGIFILPILGSLAAKVGGKAKTVPKAPPKPQPAPQTSVPPPPSLTGGTASAIGGGGLYLFGKNAAASAAHATNIFKSLSGKVPSFQKMAYSSRVKSTKLRKDFLSGKITKETYAREGLTQLLDLSLKTAQKSLRSSHSTHNMTAEVTLRAARLFEKELAHAISNRIAQGF